jgi:NAD(P)-dependent dehydrogenase (short-subunit alcohol dehydrogenase family)
VQALISEVRREFGKIDVFVANAGLCYPDSLLDQSLDRYHEQMNVNVHGVVYCAKYVGAVFKEQGFGNFIITGSMSGQVVTVPVDHTAYNTTKAAVTHLGRSLAREWRDFARVNIIAPGWIDTDMSTCEASINEAHRMAVLRRQGIVPTPYGVPAATD